MKFYYSHIVKNRRVSISNQSASVQIQIYYYRLKIRNYSASPASINKEKLIVGQVKISSMPVKLGKKKTKTTRRKTKKQFSVFIYHDIITISVYLCFWSKYWWGREPIGGMLGVTQETIVILLLLLQVQAHNHQLLRRFLTKGSIKCS